MKYHLNFLGLALYACAIALCHKTLFQTCESFADPLKNVSHGWLIFIISGHALWKQKEQLREAPTHYSFIGCFCAVLSLGLYALSRDSELLCVQQLSFISILWSLAFAIWGWGVAKLIMFPIWYLVFTISAPAVFDELILRLQNISTVSVFYVMRGFGYEVLRLGNALSSAIEGSEFQFQIAGSCSGIRSLIALTAFTAAFSWYSQKTITLKWMLFACSIPVAVICNIIRVFSICLVAVLCGQNAAIGYYHDYSGYVTALIGILLMFHPYSPIKFRCSMRSYLLIALMTCVSLNSP